MNLTKRCFFISIGVTVPLFIGIVILELVFGSWLRKDEWQLAGEINVLRNVSIDFDVEKIYGSELRTAKYTRDSNGLRGSCTDPKIISVLTVGGSTTDQRYISDGMTYQDVLQRLLSKKDDSFICVSNAGVDGHSTFGHLTSFNSWFPLIVGLKPKYVLLYVGINDAGFRLTPHIGSDTKIREESNFRHALRVNSASYRAGSLLYQLYLKSDTPIYAAHQVKLPNEREYIATNLTKGVEAHIKNNTEAFETRFKKILLQVQLLGAKPICVSQPHLLSREFGGMKKGIENAFIYEGVKYNGLDYDASIISLNNAMKFLCIESNGYYIDISSKQFPSGSFYDVVHLKQSGANYLGQYIFDEFIAQKISF
jgi:hypothetical protein